jgi:hypothetical protein
MDTQQNFDLVVSLSSDDMTASFVPACFDDYLVCVRMRQTGSRPDTNSKLQSDYDLPM